MWDWSSVPQAESYFALHQPFESQGVSFWWLDWCCDSSTASNPGVTPDSWINHLYAQEMANKNERGFVLSRTGSSYQNPDEVYPAGPWSGHTSTLAFTGDTWGTWNTLAFQVQLAADESSIDEPYVSDDIGSFLGPPPGSANNPADASDDPDVYARWVQLGTFQPILRLHSSAGNRLPWDYPQPADGIAASFLRLREALVPYTYTLADESVRTGLPINRPLYLDYPDEPAAYANPGEYLYGPDVLVAPVTTPGTVGHRVGVVPAGPVDRLVHRRHVHGALGADADGPARPHAGIREGRRDRPRAGSDERTSGPEARRAHDPPGVPGRCRPILAVRRCRRRDRLSARAVQPYANRLLVLARPGPGHPREHRPRRRPLPGGAEQPELLGPPRAPHSAGRVLVDGRRLRASAWRYDSATDTVIVPVNGLPLRDSALITVRGATPITSAEPAAVELSVDPSTPLSLSAGGSTTVTTTERDDGPGVARGLSVALSAPAGWTVTPASPVSGGDLADGQSATQSWTVTAPSGPSSPATATLIATASYRSAGRAERVTASQPGPPTPAPLPPPTITSTSPASPAPGTAVTLTGQNFGASQGSSYLTLAQGGTSWGAPYDGAKLTITNWSADSITFDLPPDSGPYPLVPGQATITVTVSGGTSAAQTLNIAGTVAPAPSITAASPSSTPPGNTVTLTGQNFGTSQGSSYLTLVQGNTSWGAPYDGAKLTISSWSDGSITFQLPPDSGSFPLTPGTATVTVTVSGQGSNPETITITS